MMLCCPCTNVYTASKHVFVVSAFLHDEWMEECTAQQPTSRCTSVDMPFPLCDSAITVTLVYMVYSRLNFIIKQGVSK